MPRNNLPDTTPEWLRHIEQSLTDMQIMVRDFILTRPSCSIMVDMGGGKTLTTLSALTYMAAQTPGHILIVAPKAIARSTWHDEINHWNIPTNTISLVNNDRGGNLSKKERYARYDQILDPATPPSMVVSSNTTLVSMIDYFIKEKRHWPFPIVVLDEAQAFKNPKAKKLKALIKARPYIKRLIQLTGTPMPNSIEDLWSQMYLIDKGRALGEKITHFRNEYCTSYTVGNDVKVYEARPGALDEILPKIEHMALSAKNTELALPEKIFDTYYVDLDDDAAALYEDLSVNSITTILTAGGKTKYAETLKNLTPGEILKKFDTDNEDVEIGSDNAAALRMKLLQISSGTVYWEDITDEEREYIAEPIDLDAEPDTILGEKTLFKVGSRKAINIHNEKTDALLDILANIDSPVIIAYTFVADKVKIIHVLRQHGYQPREFDKSPAMVHAWNKGKIPIMLIHPASAGHGLNLQHGGHDLIWYSLPDALEHYLQANARLYRPGQTHDVTIHQIVANETYDAEQPARLSGKERYQQRLLDGVYHEAGDSMVLGVE